MKAPGWGHWAYTRSISKFRNPVVFWKNLWLLGDLAVLPSSRVFYFVVFFFFNQFIPFFASFLFPFSSFFFFLLRRKGDAHASAWVGSGRTPLNAHVDGQRSKVIFPELVPSFYHMSSDVWTQVFSLGSKHLYSRTILLTLLSDLKWDLEGAGLSGPGRQLVFD